MVGVSQKAAASPKWCLHKRGTETQYSTRDLRMSLSKAAFVARHRQSKECKVLTLGFLAYDSFHVFSFHIFRVKSL